MKRALLAASLSLSFVLGFFVIAAGLQLADFGARWHPAAGLLAGLLAAAVFGLIVIYPLAQIAAIWRRSGPPGEAGSRSHQRYVAKLVRLHREYPTATLDGLPEE